MTEVAERGRRVWALVVAVVVVVVAVAVIIAFGIVPYPDLPAMADQPDPPVTGQIAYARYDGDGPCVHVVDGRGREDELGCGSAFEGSLRWIDEDRLGVQRFGGSARIDVYDVATGEVVETLVDHDEDLFDRGVLQDVAADGRRVTTGGEEGRVWVEVVDDAGAVERVLELDGPERYQLHDVGWTEDGAWIVARDSGQRVIVVDAEGRVEPRLWAQDVGDLVIR